MAPRADECDQDELSSSDNDDGFKEDMEALARACMIAGTNPDDLKAPSTVVPDDENADVLVPNALDPLLRPGDALVPVTDSDDEQSDLQYLKKVQELYQPLSHKPLNVLPALTLSDDDEDDMETLRAIMRRFSAYEEGPDKDNVDKMADGAHASSLGFEEEIANSMTYKESDPSESCPVFGDAIKTTNLLIGDVERQPCNINESCRPDACKSSKLPDKGSKFPFSAQVFIDAIKKNRSFQKLLRNKLIQLEAKIEENKRLRERVKLLKDFQVSCVRRTGQAISLKKDPRFLLISTKKSPVWSSKKKKSPVSSNSEINDKKISPLYYGPAENAHVAKYRMVLERFPLLLDRKKWSSVERENLAKGIKQKIQEIELQISVNEISSEWLCGDANGFDNIFASIKEREITPENIRDLLPQVNWDQLAYMHVVGRTGAECEARWLNCEDPLINQNPWTSEEDKLLLHIVQEFGSRNWFEIAASLNTNRTPFQCLARYQRSLNPSMLNSEWTEEEDAQLCSAVAIFGVSDWQTVASVLERRTGTQCSNRWKKSLCPERKGSFTPEEDEHLTVAVHLFGRKWNQIAKFVPGRTQAQCRDRYVNSLDPSLKWGGWTEEEDSRLKAAITKHGFCWSKVAADVPPRTDSQCRKRWRVLYPDQVPMLQAARKMQKSALISNFVDRESERPCLYSLNDFLPLAMLGPSSDPDAVNLPQKRKSKSSNTSKKRRPQKRTKKAQSCLKEEQGDEVEPCSSRHDAHEPHLEDKSVEAVYDHSPLDSVLTTTNCQGDLGGHNNINKTIKSNPMWKGCNELHEGSHTCITPCENPESGTTDGHCRKIPKGLLKDHIGRKSMRSASISDGDAVGSKVARNTTSKKGRKKVKKQSRMIRSAETAEDRLVKNKMSKPGSLSSMQILESQDEDNITLARFLHNLSNKRFKNTKKVAQPAFSSSTSSSDSVLDCDHNVAARGEVRNSQGVKLLADHDGDTTLACLLVHKSWKSSPAAKQTSACLKKGNGLLPEKVHHGRERNQELVVMQDMESEKGCINITHGTLLVQNHSCNLKNMSTMEADENRKAMSEAAEEQTMVLDGVTETKDISVGEDESNNVTLASFLKGKESKGKAVAEPVEEQPRVTEPKNVSVGGDESLDVTLANLLKKKGRRQGRASRCNIRPSHDVAK